MSSDSNAIWGDERTRLFSIIDGMLPTVLQTYRDRNQRNYLTSRQKSSEYETIRSHLKNLKVKPPTNPNPTCTTNPQHATTPPKALANSKPHISSSATTSTTSLSSDQRFSRKILRQHPPSINYITSPQLRQSLSTHIQKLLNPMHDTIALQVARDAQNASTNIDKAIGKFNVNREFYQRLDEEEKVMKFSPEVQMLLDKKRAILRDSMRKIDTAEFCSNYRLFRQKSARNMKFTKLTLYETGKKQREFKGENQELKEQFQSLINYGRDQPVKKRSHSMAKIRLPFSLDFKQFQKQTKSLERLLKEKKPILTKVNIHQRNLNKDQKRLRKLINMGDYVGYT